MTFKREIVSSQGGEVAILKWDSIGNTRNNHTSLNPVKGTFKSFIQLNPHSKSTSSIPYNFIVGALISNPASISCNCNRIPNKKTISSPKGKTPQSCKSIHPTQCNEPPSMQPSHPNKNRTINSQQVELLSTEWK